MLSEVVTCIVFETQGGTRNRTRDPAETLPKKGSAFILSSDHWTYLCSEAEHV